jgi:hypothetical protein
MEAWDALHREMAALPGVLLLGSARNEDLLPLRTLPNCTIVDVSLDEAVAARIHAGLTAAGVTTTPHWREAYGEADGLTLEFTYLLTHDRRLADVIDEQVTRRIVENRDLEVQILALASVGRIGGARH